MKNEAGVSGYILTSTKSTQVEEIANYYQDISMERHNGMLFKTLCHRYVLALMCIRKWNLVYKSAYEFLI